MHLIPNGSVANLLKMLTYLNVCCAFASACALPLGMTCFFERGSKENVSAKSINRTIVPLLPLSGGWKIVSAVFSPALLQMDCEKRGFLFSSFFLLLLNSYDVVFLAGLPLPEYRISFSWTMRSACDPGQPR